MPPLCLLGRGVAMLAALACWATTVVWLWLSHFHVWGTAPLPTTALSCQSCRWPPLGEPTPTPHPTLSFIQAETLLLLLLPPTSHPAVVGIGPSTPEVTHSLNAPVAPSAPGMKSTVLILTHRVSQAPPCVPSSSYFLGPQQLQGLCLATPCCALLCRPARWPPVLSAEGPSAPRAAPCHTGPHGS